MTYMPGQPEVPCAICGTVFSRRGMSGAGGRKWCSPECRKEGLRLADRERKGRPRRRPDIHICPRCHVNPRRERPDGTLRGWCLQCESKQKAEYLKTPAGRATLQRFWERTRAKTEPEGQCEWCGEQISRRGPKGTGQRRISFCSTQCREENKNYMDFIKRARARKNLT